MIINGKQIQEEIKQSLKEVIAHSGKTYRLVVVYVGNNPVSDRFVGMKKRFGEEIGAEVDVRHYAEDTTQEEILAEIGRFGADETCQGIIVQLPLPEHVDVEMALNAVPPEKDIDVLSEEAMRRFGDGILPFVPTVAGAVAEILKRHDISLEGKEIVVVGKGRLVGAPIIRWVEREGIKPVVIDGDTIAPDEILRKADIIIAGAGSPHMIKPDMVKDGVVLIDAGTSEQAGKLAGDIDPACSGKASLFTPVPGGVGPITIAIIFRNLLAVTK